MDYLLSKMLKYMILPIAISSIIVYINLPLNVTTVWWIIYAIILLIFSWNIIFKFQNPLDNKLMIYVKLYLAWNILSIIRGIFVAESYWHYKSLVSMGMLLLILPIISYLSLSRKNVQDFLSIFIKMGLPIAMILFPFLGIGSWGWYLYPLTLIILFFPALPIRIKVIIGILILVPILGDISARSHVIKYAFSIMLVIAFYVSEYYKIPTYIYEITRKALFVLPVILLLLGVTNVFNVFKMDEYLGNESSETKQIDENSINQELTVDTRTFIYEEVIESSIKYNYWLIGRTPARGNETKWFAAQMASIYGNPERPRNEVGIANVFTWTGIIGLILFSIIFYIASSLAIKKSNNSYLKFIGIFVAFHWTYSWVENYQVIDSNNFVIWMMVGICYSSSFRNMNNLEVKIWAKGIFSKALSISRLSILSRNYSQNISELKY